MQVAAAGTVVATLGAVDAAGQIVTYALAEPSALFEVVGNQVLLRPDVSAADAAARLAPAERDGHHQRCCEPHRGHQRHGLQPE